MPPSAEPAGLMRRVVALVYDLLLLAGPIAIFSFFVVFLRGGEPVAPATPWFSVALFALTGLFFCWFWTHGGQTLGMLAWRIQVVDTDGQPPDWRRATLRYCAAWLSLLPAGVGFLWSVVDRDRATWHDRISATRVVRTPVSEPAAASPKK